mgnify:CR=1 FL=1
MGERIAAPPFTTAFAAENTNIPEDAITITDDDGNVIYLTDSEGNVIYWYNPETGETVGDELDAGDLVIGSERAVLETGYDA